MKFIDKTVILGNKAVFRGVTPLEGNYLGSGSPPFFALSLLSMSGDRVMLNPSSNSMNTTLHHPAVHTLFRKKLSQMY